MTDADLSWQLQQGFQRQRLTTARVFSRTIFSLAMLNQFFADKNAFPCATMARYEQAPDGARDDKTHMSTLRCPIKILSSLASPSAEVGSYDLGLMLGNKLVNNGFDKAASRERLMRGNDDALAGKIPTAQRREAVQQFSRANREALATRSSRQRSSRATRMKLASRPCLRACNIGCPSRALRRPRRRQPPIRSRCGIA